MGVIGLSLINTCSPLGSFWIYCMVITQRRAGDSNQPMLMCSTMDIPIILGSQRGPFKDGTKVRITENKRAVFDCINS